MKEKTKGQWSRGRMHKNEEIKRKTDFLKYFKMILSGILDLTLWHVDAWSLP